MALIRGWRQLGGLRVKHIFFFWGGGGGGEVRVGADQCHISRTFSPLNFYSLYRQGRS